MPPKKKVIKNAFYYFMSEIKELEEAKGRTFKGGLKEVAEFASPIWNDMGPEDRQPYNRLVVKSKRQACDDLTKKFTSLGVSYAALDAEERELEEAQRKMIETVRNMVRLYPREEGLKDRRYFVVHVNYYYKNNNDVYIPAEFGIAVFSLREGIVDSKHYFINPGFSDKAHLGFRFEANDWSGKTHKIPFGDPKWDLGERNYSRLQCSIVKFLQDNDVDGDGALPPVFTMPDSLNNNTSISAVKSLFQLMSESDTKAFEYRVYPLSQLFFELRNHCIDDSAVTTNGLNQIRLPTVAIAENEIEKDVFTYAKNLGCQFHEEKDLATFCSQSIVCRWIFTICDHCCMHLGIRLILGRHCPLDADVDRFMNVPKARSNSGCGEDISISSSSHSTSPLSSSPSVGWKHVTKDFATSREKGLSKDNDFMPTIVDHGQLREKYSKEVKQNSTTSPPVTAENIRLPAKSSYSDAIKNRLPGSSGTVPKLSHMDFPQVGEFSCSSSRQPSATPRAEAANPSTKPMGRGRGLMKLYTDAQITNKTGDRKVGANLPTSNSPPSVVWPVTKRSAKSHF